MFFLWAKPGPTRWGRGRGEDFTATPNPLQDRDTCPGALVPGSAGGAEAANAKAEPKIFLRISVFNSSQEVPLLPFLQPIRHDHLMLPGEIPVIARLVRQGFRGVQHLPGQGLEGGGDAFEVGNPGIALKLDGGVLGGVDLLVAQGGALGEQVDGQIQQGVGEGELCSRLRAKGDGDDRAFDHEGSSCV